MYYSVMTQANSEKEIPSAPIRSRTQDLPITTSDALLVGAKAIKAIKLRLAFCNAAIHQLDCVTILNDL